MPTISPQSETSLQNQVIELAKLNGWLVHHCRPARTAKGYRTPLQGHKGFPDLVLTDGARVLFVELKSDYGKPSTHQKQWGDWLMSAGATYRLWRPRDWAEIVDALTRA